jgi:hypothetical protein
MSHTTGAPSAGAKVVPCPYTINWLLAGIAGLFAQVILLSGVYPLYLAYREDSMDPLLLFGSFLTADPVMARVLGFGIYLGMGIAVGLAYAILLYIFRWQGNAGKGAVFGVLVFIPMYAFIWPWTVGFLARFAPTHLSFNNPDVMFNQVGHGNVGWEPAAWTLCVYLIYGIVLGAIYRHGIREMGTRYRLEYQGG